MWRISTNDIAQRNYRDTFKVGSRVTFAAYTSVSLSDSTAESFGDRILFQFTNVRGVRIAEFSAIPSELELCPCLERGEELRKVPWRFECGTGVSRLSDERLDILVPFATIWAGNASCRLTGGCTVFFTP
ncbi:unnamed protein product [Symbiodinium sp. CCMP2592]|nr:unnamed protein product [Symbiodinium sp. CCMP2592]